ncbi:hypothetical protein [Endozoicomonas sp. ONNA1]|uniref:hypothetical protein n=1 Tax=Endozoicomonas sp. ONNA1 TaxID=2828740 RepID=UPI002148A9F4|nr:hypothetical protein [Endozoicomonas sp. ONNA1]
MSHLRTMFLSNKKEDSEGVRTLVEGLESDMQDMVELNVEVARTEQGIEEMSEIVASLESIAEAAEASLEDGGLDRHSAVMMKLAVSQQTSRLFDGEIVPSMESFGGASERLAATRVSVEGIKETIEDIWKSIKENILKLKKKIQLWFVKVFAASSKLVKKAKAIADKASNASGTAKESKITINVAKKLHIDGSVKDLKGGAATLEALATKFFDNTVKSTFKGIDRFTDVVADVDTSDQAKYDTWIKRIYEGVPDYTDGMPIAVSKSASNTSFSNDSELGAEWHASEELFGGKALWAVKFGLNTDNTTEEGRKLIHKCFSTSFVSKLDNLNTKPKEVDNEADIDTLSLSDIGAIADSVAAAAQSIVDYENRSIEGGKKKDKVTKAGDTLAKAIKSNDLDGIDGELNRVKDLPSTLVKLIDSPTNQLVGFVTGSAQALLSVCEKSLAQYK